MRHRYRLHWLFNAAAYCCAGAEFPFIRRMPVNLADDTTIFLSVHVATILWNGKERDIEVLATGRRPLLGTLLLEGHELNALFVDNGSVTIEAV